MKFDSYGLLISETCEGPGQLGDSCANQSRYVHLKYILGELNQQDGDSLEKFFTPQGTIRHPDSIWPPSDQSGDQDLALYIALNETKNEFFATTLFHQIVGNKYRTGNGQLISPVFFAILKNKKWLLNLAVIGQIAIFMCPVRYDDGQKKIKWSGSSSCDWLNFTHCLLVASPWVSKLVSREKIITKIESYYLSEPNSEWLVDLYKRAIR